MNIYGPPICSRPLGYEQNQVLVLMDFLFLGSHWTVRAEGVERKGVECVCMCVCVSVCVCIN